MVNEIDNDDWLKAAFKSEPIVDEGFSLAVMRRVRRQMFVRRWTMPVAVIIGGVIAAKPATELLIFVSRFIDMLPAQISAVPTDWLPQSPTFIIAGVLILVGSGLAQALQD